MTESWTTRDRLVWGALAVALAAVGCALAWGFTVDDALISVRYARNVAAGAGWRMSAGGPPSDGVTPLWWPVVLAPLARADALVVLDRARVLGVLAWLVAASALGSRVGAAVAPRWVKLAALVVLGACFPVAAHASSGMETGLVIALATGAAVLVDGARARGAAALAGLVASLRPEMIPWAVALALGAALAVRASRARGALLLALAVAPAALVALARVVAFGRPAPLAVLAKPSDLDHGLVYAAAAALACLTPVLAAGPVALWRARGPALVLAIAALVHLGAVTAAGGDWMPYARLVAPVAPSLALAFVRSARAARAWSLAARAALALGLGGWLLATAAPAGRGVLRDRRALVADARPVLAGARKVAALDVGWVSAATDADVVDLAGLTDLEIAALPGGHTSKRVDASMLLDRGVDAIVLYVERPNYDPTAWPDAPYSRAVEARLARDPLLAAHFGDARAIALGAHGTYFVLRRTP